MEKLNALFRGRRGIRTHTMDSLTHEQRIVFQHLLRGNNLFLTGGGGVGKSYLLSVVHSELPEWKKRWEGKPIRIQMCAMTGCAALLLHSTAKTLHSWSGIGLGKGEVKDLHLKIRRNPKAFRRWLTTDLLIIDEVSMMTAELLDKLNALAKKIRSNSRPFGGIQLVLVGDFYQLPPIRRDGVGANAPLFAFEAACWNELIPHAHELLQIQRQKDEAFQTILKEARVGKLSKESCAILESRRNVEWRQNKIRPTLLFPRRAEVDMINETNFRALTGRRETYAARLLYDGKVPMGFDEKSEEFQRALHMMDTESAYLKELALAEEAQVMLIANINPDAGLVNGSRGVLVGFCATTGLPIVEFINGRRETVGHHSWPLEDYPFACRSQIPLRLAYAYTIHKAQGASLDSALVDIGSGNFEFGQAYVALSRVRSLDALYVYDFDPIVFRGHSRVKTFYGSMKVLDGSLELLEFLEKRMRVTPVPTASGVEEEKAIVELKETIAESSPDGALESQRLDSAEALQSAPDSTLESAPDGALEPGTNWLWLSLPENWKHYFVPCEETLSRLSSWLSTQVFLPPASQLWNALVLTPPEQVRVVIVGQDPYPTPGHAHGLAFSVTSEVRPLPPSLLNLYKEMATDLGCERPTQGDLTAWAEQGVLLWNTLLTVEPGKPLAHAKKGWEDVSDQLLRTLSTESQGIVFVLWGKTAQAKKKILSLTGHRVVEAAHPSPLSASRGFFGSRPFSTINQLLGEMGREPIQWYKP